MTAAASSSRWIWSGVAAAIVLGLAFVVAAALLVSRESAGPIDDDRVVATLNAGARYPDDLRELLRASRANPGDRVMAKRAARRLIEEGRSAGDSRLVGGALAMLRPWIDAPASADSRPTAQLPAHETDVETLLLAATARQYQHDFTGALALLDRATATAPRDATVLLTRATIHVVRGHLDLARQDCRRLFALGRTDLGFICQATASTLTADAPAIYARLEAIVAQVGILRPELRGYALALMGEIAALQGHRDRGRLHLTDVLASDPGALRVRMMLADLELSAGHAAKALALLQGAAEVDGVLLRRVIAADRIGDAKAAGPAKAELARRFRLNLDLALSAHAREEARYFLEVQPDPGLALRRAAVNWNLQREIEDAQLLIDAAVAANAPEAAAPVLHWIAEQRIAVPTLRIPTAVRDAAK